MIANNWPYKTPKSRMYGYRYGANYCTWTHKIRSQWSGPGYWPTVIVPGNTHWSTERVECKLDDVLQPSKWNFVTLKVLVKFENIFSLEFFQRVTRQKIAKLILLQLLWSQSFLFFLSRYNDISQENDIWSPSQRDSSRHWHGHNVMLLSLSFLTNCSTY